MKTNFISADLAAVGMPCPHLRARGVYAAVSHYTDAIGTWVRVVIDGDNYGYILSPKQFRSIMAAIMDTPVDTSSKPLCERIIRGDS
jgi:hypothetical protein